MHQSCFQLINKYQDLLRDMNVNSVSSRPPRRMNVSSVSSGTVYLQGHVVHTENGKAIPHDAGMSCAQPCADEM